MSAALWLLGAAIGFPSSANSPTLSLNEAIQLAIAHSTDIRIAKNDVRTAKARVGEQASRGNLLGGVSGSATRYDNKTMLSLGGSSFEVVPIHQETLTAQLSQLIDVTGQVATSVSQARLGAYAAEFNLRARTSDQILATTTTYYMVLRAAEAVKVAQAALEAYQEQLRTTTLLWKEGVGQRIDVYRASSQVADAERELLRRQNDLNSVRSALNDQIGRALDTDIQLAEELPRGVDEVSTTPRAQLIVQALERRSEILSSEMNVAAAQKGIKIARADAEPLVSLGLSGNYYPTTSFSNPRHSIAGLMVSVSFPILDGGLARNRTDEARAIVDSAKAQEDQTKRTIALQVQNASLDVETAKKRFDAAEESLKAAEEARKLAQQRYAAQVAQYLEVTDAQAALTAAQAAKVDAHYDLLTAQAKLARASGALDSTESTTTKKDIQPISGARKS